MFFRKLNKKFDLGSYHKTGNKIEYGMETPFGFAGIRYSYINSEDEDDLLKVIPEQNREDCTLSLMELNYKIPPHTDSNIEAIVNFYIKTDRCITQFYYPKENTPQTKIKNQSDGAIFHEDYLKKSVRFIAEPGDAYLLDVSKPHSVFPHEGSVADRKAICLQILYKSFDEAVEMLKSTGYIDE